MYIPINRTFPESRMTAPQERTVDSFWADHLAFETSGGGDLKKAKHYNNAID